MRARDTILPFVTSLAIFSMAIFISCASSERVDNDTVDTQETSVGDNGAPVDPTAPPTGTADAGAPTGDQPPAADGGGLQPDGGTQPPVDASAQLPADPNAPPADPNALPPQQDAALSPPPGNDQLPPQNEPQTANGNVFPPPPGSEDVASPPQEPTQAPVAQNEPAPDTAPSEPPVSTTAVSHKHHRKSHTLRVAHVGHGGGGHHYLPKVPARALKKYHASLNRFYFVRKGDTPESVATLIYSDGKMGKKLAKWNGGRGSFVPGKLAFYASPTQPDDDTMKSFYQERDLTPEEYQIQKGDWLSRVASQKLGSKWSWKELAVVNNISDPRKIEPGQKLAIYTSLSGGQPAVAMNNDQPPPQRSHRKGHDTQADAAQNTPPPPAAKPIVEAQAPLNPDDPTVQGINSDAPPQLGAPSPTPTPEVAANTFNKTKAKKGGSFDMARFLQQNLFFVVILGGVSVLGLALTAVSRRRRAQAAEEFGSDDGFAPPKRRRG